VLPRFFRDAGVLALTEAALRLKGLVLLPILTRHFGTVNYGVWTQVAVMAGMVSPLLMAGMDSAVARFLPGRSKEDIRREFSAMLVYLVAVSAAGAIVLWLAARPLAGAFFGGAENARFVILAGGVVATGIGTTAGRLYFRVVGRAFAYGATNVAQSLAATGLTIAVVMTDGGAYEVVRLVLLGDAVLLAIMLAVIARDGAIGTPDARVLGRFLRFGIVLMPAGYATVALNQIDRLFLVHMKGLDAVGVYAVAYSLGYLLISLVFNPIWVMYPTAAAELYNTGRIDEIRRLARRSLKIALGLMIPAMTGWYVLARPIMVLIASDAFVEGARLVPIITLAYTLHMIASYYSISLALKHRQIWSTVSLGIAMVVNIALNATLIPPFGLAGAAWATLAGFSVQLIIEAYLGSRAVPLGFDFVFLAKVVAASAIMGLVVWVIPWGGPVGIGLRALTGAAVFAAAMLVVRAVTFPEIRSAFATAVPWNRDDSESVPADERGGAA